MPDLSHRRQNSVSLVHRHTHNVVDVPVDGPVGIRPRLMNVEPMSERSGGVEQLAVLQYEKI